MPVLYPSGYVDTVAGLNFHGIFVPLPIVPAPTNTDQNLPAALVGTVVVPIVPASYLNGSASFHTSLASRNTAHALGQPT